MKNLALIMMFSALTLLGSVNSIAQATEDLATIENLAIDDATDETPTVENAMPVEKVTFGGKLGALSSSICGEQASSFAMMIGILAAVVVQIPIAGRMAVQPEVQFATQGAKYEDEYYEGKYKLNYLNLPILAKYYITDGLSLEAGPQVGFLLSAKDEYTYDGGEGEDDVKDQTKSVAFAAAFGVGYQLDMGVNFGLRYNLGLSRIDNFDEMPLEGGEEVKWKNHVMQLHVGYNF